MPNIARGILIYLISITLLDIYAEILCVSNAVILWSKLDEYCFGTL